MKSAKAIRAIMPFAAAIAASAAFGVMPEVENVGFSQDASHVVTITYDLKNTSGVVTVDVQTNCAATGEWVSIGDGNIGDLGGDVNCEVAAGTGRTITWRPWKSWPGHSIPANGSRVVVRAWAMNATPDYLVVDLTGMAEKKIRYFTSEDALPGGLLANEEYRKSMMVLRKIPARNVTWVMGANATIETPTYTESLSHSVTLTNDYYIGVFPVTQMQWQYVNGAVRSKPSYYNDVCTTNWMLRPVEQVSYNEIRNGDSRDSADIVWPNPPGAGSFLYRMRSLLGNKLDFDLPSEAQWEFAARAGCGMGYHSNGLTVGDQYVDANIPGRYRMNGGRDYNGGDTSVAANFGTYVRGTGIIDGATAAVGSYAPNNWGLYDTQGNVYEFCLDHYCRDILSMNGAVITTENGGDAANVARRGGSWSREARLCRLGQRISDTATALNYENGFRVACRGGLE